jgi:hypothetical protein
MNSPNHIVVKIKKCGHCHKKFEVGPGCIHCLQCKKWWCVKCIDQYDDEIYDNHEITDNNSLKYLGLKIGEYGEYYAKGNKCDYCGSHMIDYKLFQESRKQKKHIKQLTETLTELQKIICATYTMVNFEPNMPGYIEAQDEFNKTKERVGKQKESFN